MVTRTYAEGSDPTRGTPNMLAREKWQIKTIQALDLVFAERVSQREKHGEAMRELPDGVGPRVKWLEGVSDIPADSAQEAFREDYESHTVAPGMIVPQLTRMHLVREELAEAFECEGDSDEFLAEIIQVAALCVQWAEYKLEDRAL